MIQRAYSFPFFLLPRACIAHWIVCSISIGMCRSASCCWSSFDWLHCCRYSSLPFSVCISNARATIAKVWWQKECWKNSFTPLSLSFSRQRFSPTHSCYVLRLTGSAQSYDNKKCNSNGPLHSRINSHSSDNGSEIDFLSAGLCTTTRFTLRTRHTHNEWKRAE